MTIFTALDLQRVSLLSQLYDYDEWFVRRALSEESNFDINNITSHYSTYIKDAF